jgi:NAD(P)-dependent dehydrogenase (short-subunit alcohol dehydrogenase family)
MISIDLSGKCALVTGASQGIGRACAEWLARAGAGVALAARNAENLAEVAAGIRREGGRAEELPLDLTEEGKPEWAVDETARRFGGLDIVVNVAGVSRRSDPIDVSNDDIDLAIDLKLRSAVATTRAAVPHLRARGGGNIIFTSGLGHVHTHVFHGSGCMPNAALAAFKHQLAKRLAPDGIRVNMVNPGATVTPRMERQTKRASELTGKSIEEVMEERLKAIPLGRFISSDDIAKTVLYLVSDLADCVTGNSINVDGGECNAVRV